jgi:hypothetical protein
VVVAALGDLRWHLARRVRGWQGDAPQQLPPSSYMLRRTLRCRCRSVRVLYAPTLRWASELTLCCDVGLGCDMPPRGWLPGVG